MRKMKVPVSPHPGRPGEAGQGRQKMKINKVQIKGQVSGIMASGEYALRNEEKLLELRFKDGPIVRHKEGGIEIEFNPITKVVISPYYEHLVEFEATRDGVEVSIREIASGRYIIGFPKRNTEVEVSQHVIRVKHGLDKITMWVEY